MVNFTRTLEIAGTSGFVQPIKLVQYDATLPVGVFELVENGQPFDIPAGAKAKVRMRKADGKGVYNDAAISGHTVQVVVTQQMTAAFGVGFLNIELSYDGGVKSSEPVQVVVLENAVQQGAIESADEFLTLDEIVKQVETLRQQTATDAAAAVASKTAAASSATAAQAARAGAEAAESRVNAIVAGNESYTKRQSRNLFARALKAETDKAASLEIYPDEGSNVVVTAYGFTAQAGSGDPSPTNVRQITVGGKKLVEVVFNGSESWGVGAAGRINTVLSIPAVPYGTLYANCIKKNSITTAGGAFTDIGKLWLNPTGGQFSSVYPGLTVDNVGTEWPKRLKEKPLIIWYQPADESQATGIYTPIESTGAEYSCVCVPLTAPLCEGDTVETCVKSGCDKMIVFDGSGDEGWSKYTTGTARASFRIENALKGVNNSLLIAFGDTISNKNGSSENDRDGLTFRGTMYNEAMYIFGPLEWTVENLRSYLSENPLTVWYRSTEYTEENDIPVCLERHLQSLRVFTGDESFSLSGSVSNLFQSNIIANGKNFTAACNQYKYGGSAWASMPDYSVLNASTLVGFRDSRFSSVSDFKANLSAQYAAGTPATIVYQLAAPITYAHDPVYLDAYPDGNGKFTVSGEKLVSAFYNKSLSKAFEELQSAVLAMGANLSS